RRDDGDSAGVDRLRDCREARRPRLADEPELRHGVSVEPYLVAEEGDGPPTDRGTQFGVHSRERATHDLETFRRRDAAAVDELDWYPLSRHLDRDLRAGAVDDADVVGPRELDDSLCRARRDGTSHLHDDDHVL